MTDKATDVTVTQADKALTAEILGFLDWEDATDYRVSGAVDRDRERIVRLVSAHRTASEQPASGETIDPDDLGRLDNAIDFANAIAGFSLASLADDLWNLRNLLAPFPKGHRHHPDELDAPSIEEAAQAVIASANDYYTARNGKRMGIEGDDGEKCWIVPFDQFEDLRRALSTTSEAPEAGRLREALEAMLDQFDADEFGSEGQMQACSKARAALTPSALSGEPVQKMHELPRDLGARAIELLREYYDAEEIDDVDARSSELGACRFSVRAFLKGE
ncbi:hypothetical protein CVO77_00155 [Sphingopyxis lindanitolerans]|uniref:Uncharacterized protein n=1 Tax=Sphingopyxis lindanitolerans TaxID=2054227 RepID=A0A2S8BAK8_9SPHN|nr:hypothetical protein [Sphingopyxis lindanitolerans]PQM29387.1 hypothetical protein CVO77_00155 [Sphingopyxis lindanitolerans]